MSSKKKNTRFSSFKNNGKAAPSVSPASAPAIFSRAVQRHQEGRFGEAEALYRQVLRADPRHADALHLLGVALHQQGRHDLAVEWIRQAITVKNTEPLFYGTLGSALQSLDDRAGAMAAYERALSLDPGYAEAHNNVGVMLKEDERDAAKARFQQALRFRPDYAEALNNLGTVLQAEGDLEPAAALYRRAFALKPDYAAAHNNLGTVLQVSGDLSGASASFHEALRLAPDFAEAHFNLSMVQLTQGDFARGWAGYQWGLKTAMRKTHPFTQPRWNGEPLAGRTLLVHAEQGFGDTFQFVRYLPLIRERWCGDGSRIVFACQDGLGRVLKNANGFDRLVESTAGAQSPPSFDVQVPLLNLPAIAGTTPDSIPGGVPYLHAEPELAAHWQARLDATAGGDFKVGIVWAGSAAHVNDRNRSCRLTDFAPLARIGGMRLFSLQKGAPSRQADELGAEMNLVRLDQEMGDWADTAAAIAGLDLVITVDTAVAHLAGALGKPVWVVLPHGGEWRWLQDREDSPWYPTMRLFRQERPGDWAGVFARIVAGLCGAAEETEASETSPDGGPLVSVIIPCYKQAHFLAEAVESVVAQTCRSWEIVIVNDGSPDNTSEVARDLIARHPDRRIRLIEQANGGLSAARNAGIRASQGPYILPLDADDKLHPQMLGKTVAVLESWPDMAVAYTHIQHFGAENNVWCVGTFTLERACEKNQIPYCSLYRRALFDAVGGYREDCAAYEDWDFWLHALERGYQGVLVPEPLFLYRKSPTSKLVRDNQFQEFFTAQIVLNHPALYERSRLEQAKETLREAERAPIAAATQPPPDTEDVAAAADAGGLEDRPCALILTHAFYPSVGGTERLVESVGLSLQKAGWDVEILTDPLPERRGKTHRGMRIHEFQEGDRLQFAGRLVQTRDFQAILAFSDPVAWPILLAPQLPKPRPRVIVVPCVDEYRYNLLHEQDGLVQQYGDIVRAADVVGYSSRDGWDARLCGDLGIEGVYLPNAITKTPVAGDHFRARYGIPQDVPLLLLVANLFAVKNHAGLLNQLREHPGNWRLVVIGAPTENEPHTAGEVRQLAALDERVLHIPGAPAEVIAAAMAEADLFLLPSLADATPLVLLEAMSHRLPWIATPTCGNARECSGGVMLPLEHFPGGIEYLLRHAEERRALGEAGYAHWSACYTWDVVGPRYAALLSGDAALPALDAPAQAARQTCEVSARVRKLAAGSTPRISVVLTTRNDAGRLRQVLAAYERQTLPADQFEVVVVDNACDEQTATFLAAYKPPFALLWQRLGRKANLAAARNAGAGVSRGDLLLFLDDDLALTPGFLEEHVRTHEAHPEETVGVAGRLEAAPGLADSVLLQTLLRSEPPMHPRYRATGGSGFHESFVSIKRSLFVASGMYDESLPAGAEDAELAWRLKGHGLAVVACPKATLQVSGLPTYIEVCQHREKEGRAVAWAAEKHRDSGLLHLLQVANGEGRFDPLHGQWLRAAGEMERSVAAIQNAGWAAVSRSPDFADFYPALSLLTRLGLDYYHLRGFVQGRKEQRRQADQGAGRRDALSGDKALVSVITPCYNYARYLPETVASVVAQTYRNWELIIVNDGSTDDTRAVAEQLIARYGDRHRIRLINQENQGLANARNSGIREAVGTYILPLDADDQIKPAMLAECVDVLERSPHLSFVYTNQEHYNERNVIWIAYSRDWDWGEEPHNNQLCATALFRRTMWEEVGGYRGSCESYEDWDFWIACGKRGHQGWRIPQPLFRYYKHSDSMLHADAHRANYLTADIVCHHPDVYDEAKRRWARGVRDAHRWLHPKYPKQIAPPDALVSVIVPTYNRPRTLVEAVKSVLAQTYQNFEILVVNDAGEPVEPYLEPFADDRIHILNKPENRGLSDSRNLAITAARGKYIAYLDDDDQYYPDHLETLVTFLENTSHKAAYTDSLRAHQKKVGDRYEVTHTDQFWCNDFDYDGILVSNLAPPVCFMHEKSCLEQSGVFDVSLDFHEDWDLWIRMSRAHDFVHLRKVTCLYSWREDGTSMTSDKREAQLRTARVIYQRNRKEYAQDKPQILTHIDAALARDEKQGAVAKPMAPSPPKAGATPRLDVLVVVHNQLEYVKRCIASLQKHTPNFRLLVWDNASDDETRRYLQKLARRKDVVLVRSEENLGFIVPNNRLAAQSSAPYLVLLNSDTEVHAGWDRALIAHLEAHPDVAEVGYGGGLLGPDAVGCGSGTGDAIDYVGGWCACIPRWVYETFGLFDEENLHFAYGEDSDFSLRLKEAGHKVHALSEPLVLHHGNKTILEVAGTRDTSATFRANHDYLRRRWAKYLREGRVLAPKTSELERLMNRGKELAAAQRAA